MDLWMPMIAWGVVMLVRTLIEWRARIHYERVRAASVADVLRVVPRGVTVLDKRADGTVFHIGSATRQELRKHSTLELRGRKPC